MKPITCWEDLLEEAHPLAVKKGWWENMDRPIDEQCACFHSEISEAFEEYRSKRMDTWYSLGGVTVVNVAHNADGCPGVFSGGNDDFTPAKPEGFWVEIADLLIRLADTCGRYGIGINSTKCSHPEKVTIATFVTRLHWLAADALPWLEAKDWASAMENATDIVRVCETQAGLHGVDLWPIVNEKLAYNRTRAHRHGGKAA